MFQPLILASVLALPLAQTEGTTNVTNSAMMCITGNCPLKSSTMAPDSWCVMRNCFGDVGKCMFESSCRHELLCVSHCIAPLANTTEADHFVALQDCMKERCPGFPPSKACVAVHCSAQAIKCEMHSQCRHALQCADSCSSQRTAREVDEIVMATRSDTFSEQAAKLDENLSKVAGEALTCISNKCPMNANTMSASPFCVVEHCFLEVSKCAFKRPCRNELLCMDKCTSPLAKTDDAKYFLAMQTCLTEKCPGFPPSKTCVAAHCGFEAIKCAMHTHCRQALECANSCQSQEDTISTDAGGVIQSSANLIQQTNAANSAVMCLNNNCPLALETMSPSPFCVLRHCFTDVGKCAFQSSCRHELLCISNCTAPLANTSDAGRFLALQNCMNEHCPGFPPSKSCVALHCSKQALSCEMHSQCRHALQCADSCSTKASADDARSKAEVAALTSSTLECVSNHCPLNAKSMSPNPFCALHHCFVNGTRCAFHAACRNELLCISQCTAPLANTTEAVHFLALQSCANEHCPGFPPSKTCVAMHCSGQAVKCEMHSQCRHVLQCADACSSSTIEATAPNGSLIVV